MSHVVTASPPPVDGVEPTLEDWEGAAAILGGEFLPDRSTYAWYGRSVGDYPLPAGFAEADLGKCEHAIRFPGVRYEVGLVRREGRWVAIYDFWDRELGAKVGGAAGTLLTDAVAAAARQRAIAAQMTRTAALLRRPATTQRLADGGLRVQVTVPGG